MASLAVLPVHDPRTGNQHAILPNASNMSLALPDDLSFERWQAIGRELFARERVTQWWIGDWWAFGEHRYGERAKAAASGIWGLAFGTLRNLGSVARSFETSRRRDVLPFSHHAEVASLPPAEADALLDRATAEAMSARDVRKFATERKLALGIVRPRDEAEPDPEHSELVSICRAWNYARRSVREEFIELARESDFGVIDA